MKNGKLNKREIQVLGRAMDILNDWAEYKEAQSAVLDDHQWDMACDAVVAIAEFLHEESEA